MSMPSDDVTAGTALPHPCLRCGACCACYRVAFYWAETAPHTPDGIPEALTAKLDPLRVAMRGTDQPTPRCVVLRGTVGVDAHCGDYQRRPSPCHELQPAWETGQPSPQCDRARLRHGMTPLQPRDWEAWRSQLTSADPEPSA
jgi:Fe-S-cluster containining protein